MGYFIPKTLRDIPQWVLWKENKIPYQVKYDRKASCTDKKQWSSFDEASAKLLNNDEYKGLGFVFDLKNNLTFIDLDHCIDEQGNINKFAEDIMEQCKGTYIETSQSGKGIHIICKGRIEKTIKRPEIEIYSEKRYVALTGDVIEPAEPAELQDVLTLLYKTYERTSPIEALKGPITQESSNKHKTIRLIEKSAQGGKFKALHYGGWEALGLYVKADGVTPDHSAADMAYFAIVNHFTGGNDALTIDIFKDSALARREKAKRDDYILLTLSKAKRTHKGTGGLLQRRGSVEDQPIKKRRF